MIREFEEPDLKQVMRIWLKENIDAHHFIPKEYWESNFEMVQDQIVQAEVYVFESEKSIRGFIGIVDGYIAGIFVDKKHRSLGIGKKLLNYAKRTYTALSLGVYQKNSRAVRFYLREGFSIVSEQTDEATGENDYKMEWSAENEGASLPG